MKKFIIAAVIAMIGMPLASMADEQTVDGVVTIGYGTEGDTGGYLYADGDRELEQPLAGYAGVEGDAGSQSGGLECDDDGDWNDQDGDGTPDDQEDPAQGRDGCAP